MHRLISALLALVALVQLHDAHAAVPTAAPTRGYFRRLEPGLCPGATLTAGSSLAACRAACDASPTCKAFSLNTLNFCFLSTDDCCGQLSLPEENGVSYTDFANGCPTPGPTPAPTTLAPTTTPTQLPTTPAPTEVPTLPPTTTSPTPSPQTAPTESPTTVPTRVPTLSPSDSPTSAPTRDFAAHNVGLLCSGATFEFGVAGTVEACAQACALSPTCNSFSIAFGGCLLSPTDCCSDFLTFEKNAQSYFYLRNNCPTSAPTRTPTTPPTNTPTTTPTGAPTTPSPTPSPTAPFIPHGRNKLCPDAEVAFGVAANPADCHAACLASPTCNAFAIGFGGCMLAAGTCCSGLLDIPDTRSYVLPGSGCTTFAPTRSPTTSPTSAPTAAPTEVPTLTPTNSPTTSPTAAFFRHRSNVICPDSIVVATAGVNLEAECRIACEQDVTCLAYTVALNGCTLSSDLCCSPIPTVIQSRSYYRQDNGCPALPATLSPTLSPTATPTPAPSGQPTPSPSPAPTPQPSPGPTDSPTTSPTDAPTVSPTAAPTAKPTAGPVPPPTSQCAAANPFTSLPVANGGFEANVLVPTTFVKVIDGWTRVLGTRSGTFFPSGASQGTAPAGSNVAYVGANSAIAQQIAGSAIMADTLYTLTVVVRSRPDQAEFPGYNVMLAAMVSGTRMTLVQDLNTKTIAKGSTATISIDVLLPATHAAIGSPLEIYLGSTQTLSGQVQYDSVTLTRLSGTCALELGLRTPTPTAAPTTTPTGSPVVVTSPPTAAPFTPSPTSSPTLSPTASPTSSPTIYEIVLVLESAFQLLAGNLNPPRAEPAGYICLGGAEIDTRNSLHIRANLISPPADSGSVLEVRDSRTGTTVFGSGSSDITRTGTAGNTVLSGVWSRLTLQERRDLRDGFFYVYVRSTLGEAFAAPLDEFSSLVVPPAPTPTTSPTPSPTETVSIPLGTTSVLLTGASEVPPVNNQPGAFAVMGIDLDVNYNLDFTVSFGGASGRLTAGHFHGPAPKGSTNRPLFNFSDRLPATGTNGTFTGRWPAMTKQQVEYLRQGLIYVNLHTALNPGGEFRGQIEGLGGVPVPVTTAPTLAPTTTPTLSPTDAPTSSPTDAPTKSPTDAPTNAPTVTALASRDITLLGSNVRPTAVSSAVFGFAKIRLLDTRVLQVEVEINAQSSTTFQLVSVSIHGPAGTSGVAASIASLPASSFTVSSKVHRGTLQLALNKATYDDLQDGLLYISVNSVARPAGLLRGQVVGFSLVPDYITDSPTRAPTLSPTANPTNTPTFSPTTASPTMPPPLESQSVVLTGLAVVPPATTGNTGSAVVNLEVDFTLTINLVLPEGFRFDANLAIEVRGPAGVGSNGALVAALVASSLAVASPSVLISGSVGPLTNSQLLDLQGGMLYLVVSTTSFPSGELRAQLVDFSGVTVPSPTPAPTPSTSAPTDAPVTELDSQGFILLGQNVVPPVTTTLAGTLTMRILSNLTAFYSASISAFPGSGAPGITGSSFHGPADSASTASAVYTAEPYTGSGTFFETAGSLQLTLTDFNNIKAGLWYYEVQTASHPGGALRAQLSGLLQPKPTPSPTASPTTQPTGAPVEGTPSPTLQPTDAPTNVPSFSPTEATPSPTSAPSDAPTASPTTLAPTDSPITPSPTEAPVRVPTDAPTPRAVTSTPTEAPRGVTSTPTEAPSVETNSPTSAPSLAPTDTPTNNPTDAPTNTPTRPPTSTPTAPPAAATPAPTAAPGGFCDTDSDVCDATSGNSLTALTSLSNAGLSATKGVAVMDVNNDGKLDVVAGGFNSLMVFFGDGAGGTIGSPQTISLGGISLFLVSAIAAGDLNGDGFDDLVVAMSFANAVVALQNNQAGGFGSPLTLATPTSPVMVRIVDFDGDKRPDVFVADVNAEQILFAKNNGGMTFATATAVVSSTLLDPFSFAVGDVDSDGTLDVVVGFHASNVLAYYAGLGGGAVSTTRQAIAEGSSNRRPRSVEVADIDGDGRADDVVVSFEVISSSIGKVSWFRRESSGTWTQTTIDSSVNTATAMTVFDANNDGAMDVVAASNQNPGTVRLYRNSGTGTFTSVSISGFNRPELLLTGDLDGDQDRDIIGVAGGANSVLLIRNGLNGGSTCSGGSCSATP